VHSIQGSCGSSAAAVPGQAAACQQAQTTTTTTYIQQATITTTGTATIRSITVTPGYATVALHEFVYQNDFTGFREKMKSLDNRESLPMLVGALQSTDDKVRASMSLHTLIVTDFGPVQLQCCNTPSCAACAGHDRRPSTSLCWPLGGVADAHAGSGQAERTLGPTTSQHLQKVGACKSHARCVLACSVTLCPIKKLYRAHSESCQGSTTPGNKREAGQPVQATAHPASVQLLHYHKSALLQPPSTICQA
jgi:hypothetical protein